MSSLLQFDNALYLDSEGVFNPLTKLYFYRHDLTLIPESACDIQNEDYYCAQTMNNMPKNDFFHKGGQSNSSKLCPLNSNILKPKIVKSEQKTTESSTEPTDEKSYYLVDQLSGWSTREIGLPDSENMSVEGWPSAKNPHQEYYDTMKNYLASDMVNYLKDSQDRENKINSLHENAKKHTNSFGLNSFKNSSNPLAAILADKYGNKYATGRSLADLRNSRLFKKPGESNMTRIQQFSSIFFMLFSILFYLVKL